MNYSFPFSSNIRLACVCFFALFMMVTQFSKYLKKANIYVLFCVLFCIWSTLSYIWASSAEGVSDQLTNMYLALMTNISMALYIVRKQEDINDIYSWFLPVMTLYLVQSLLIGTWDADMRFSTVSTHANQFGICTSYMYLISLYVLKTHKRTSIISKIVPILALGLTIVTGSRKALINLVLFTCMVFWFEKYNKNFSKTIAKLMAIFAVAALALILILNVDALYQIIGNRIVTLFAYFNGDVEQDLSALRRTYMKQDAIALFLEHPLTGVGLNNFKYVTRYGTYAHSNYYELLCCLGLVGTLLYYIPILTVFVKAFLHWKKNLPDAVIPFAILLALIINDFSNISYMYRIIHIFVGIAAGMVLVNDKKVRELRI